MSQYGATQNVPYTGQQDSELVNNPRYQGQSGGTVPQGATGPQQESRYGAAPLSTTGMQHGQHGTGQGTGQGGYGPPPTTGGYGSNPNAQAGQSTGGYGSNPNAQSGYGSQTAGGYGSDPNARGTQTGYGDQPTTGGYGTERAAGMVNPNTRPDQAGYGSQSTGGYGTHRQGESEFAKEQPGYGQPGFGAPSEGQHTGSLWPQPATPPNAHKHDLMGGGQGGYGHQQQTQGGYDQQQQTQGGYGGYGQQQPGQSPYTQGGGYDQPPRKEGVMDKVKDAVGVGPRSQGTAPGQEYNVNHPSGETGFGGGHGQHPHGAHDQLGGGYNTGMATGADAYSQSQPQPRKEGMVDKVKDAVGVGPNTSSGYDARTKTGNDAYVHGNHPMGMQDRVQGVNEPSMFGGEHGVHAPVGQRDGVLRQGEHMPESLMGETRTEPGYDASKGHLSGDGRHQTLGGVTGLGGGHHNTGMDSTGLDEKRGKGFEDTTGPYDSKFGSDTGTGTGHKTGADTYDETTGTGMGSTGTGLGTGSGYDDTSTGSAPPKKGLMTKIKEKMHH